jgi:hypothetical protein
MNSLKGSITLLVATLATIGVGVHVQAFGSSNPRCRPASAVSVATLFAPCQASDPAAMERPASDRELAPPAPAKPQAKPVDKPSETASGEHATVGVAGSSRRH